MKMNQASLCWAVLILVAMGAAGTPGAAAQKRAEHPKGTWRFAALESEEKGWEAPWPTIKTWRWVVGDKEIAGPDPVAGNSKASFKLNPKKSPKQIDITFPDGLGGGKTFQGIYKLDKGTLTVSLRNDVKAAQGRPKDFVFRGDAGLTLLILKRVSDKK
jgi:uncharacterized protein (TIGR03067 family)